MIALLKKPFRMKFAPVYFRKFADYAMSTQQNIKIKSWHSTTRGYSVRQIWQVFPSSSVIMTK